MKLLLQELRSVLVLLLVGCGDGPQRRLIALLHPSAVHAVLELEQLVTELLQHVRDVCYHGDQLMHCLLLMPLLLFGSATVL
jgi:hypothetical protein